MKRFFKLLPLIAIIAFACSCSSPPASPVPPQHLPQRGYLWQRNWTHAVKDAVRVADSHTDGTVILAAEIDWDGTTAHPVLAPIDWELVRQLAHPCALGVRIALFHGSFGSNDTRINQIIPVIRSILVEASSRRVTISELQLDFDCPQSKLPMYAQWLQELLPIVRPIPLVITTLPAWLKEPAFAQLISIPDSYVLQVHSVPTAQETGRAVLCEPQLARRWVDQASALGVPFSVSLPTYWCLAGYDPHGHLLGVCMDSVQPAWPPNTHTLEFGVEADEIADLVHDWQAAPPPGMKGILWYRLPVASDQHNWEWPTLLAVMQGRHPTRHLEVVNRGDSPVDFYLKNSGEADEHLHEQVIIQWTQAQITASDALPGWSLSQQGNCAIFLSDSSGSLRLSPGAELGIGWIRFDQTPLLQIVTTHEPPTSH